MWRSPGSWRATSTLPECGPGLPCHTSRCDTPLQVANAIGGQPVVESLATASLLIVASEQQVDRNVREAFSSSADWGGGGGERGGRREEFLTNAEEQAYGHFVGTPTQSATVPLVPPRRCRPCARQRPSWSTPENVDTASRAPCSRVAAVSCDRRIARPWRISSARSG